MSKRLTIAEVCEGLPSQIDLFICSASFEERSSVIPLQIDSSRVKNVLVFSDHIVCGSVGREKTEQILQHFGSAATFVPLILKDPLATADSMMEAFSKLCDISCTYVIDVTTFSHESLLILMKVMSIWIKPHDEIIGVYNSATEYSVGLDFAEKWLTHGVTEVRSVLGFAGGLLPTQSQHLIVLAGFEVDRAETLIDVCEPGYLSIGLGRTGTATNTEHYDLNRNAYKTILGKYKEASGFEFASNDVEETMNAVVSEARLRSGYNVVVAPLNTKISTIGVALAALEDETIQVCYAVPEEYNMAGYASASDFGYLFQIPLVPAITAL